MMTIWFIKLLWLSVSQTQKYQRKYRLKNVFKPWQQKWWIYFALVVRDIFSTWKKCQTFRQMGPGNSERRTKVTKMKNKIRPKTPQNQLICKYIKTVACFTPFSTNQILDNLANKKPSINLKTSLSETALNKLNVNKCVEFIFSYWKWFEIIEMVLFKINALVRDHFCHLNKFNLYNPIGTILGSSPTLYIFILDSNFWWAYVYQMAMNIVASSYLHHRIGTFLVFWKFAMEIFYSSEIEFDWTLTVFWIFNSVSISSPVTWWIM